MFHSVRGTSRHGLIVDPGAASALMGTETLRTFLEDQNLKVTMEPSCSTFTGVDGRPEPAVGPLGHLVVQLVPEQGWHLDPHGARRHRFAHFVDQSFVHGLRALLAAH